MGKRKWKQMTETKEKRRTRSTTLFDLPVEDIMMTHVAQYLRMMDLINLRLCSRKCKDLADVMFAGIRSFGLLSYGRYEGGVTTLFLNKTRRLRSFNSNTHYTDELVHDVLSNNYLLSTVIITYCPYITSWGLMPLAEYCKNISNLSLADVPISDEFVRALGRHKLIKLSLIIDKNDKNMKCPSQETLQAFFKKQLIIEKVLLFHTIDLSPIVSTIANFCPNLNDFDINECVLSDDKVLIELANKCPKLEHLNVSKLTPSVSDEVLNELRSNQKYQRDMLYESDESDSNLESNSLSDDEDLWNFDESDEVDENNTSEEIEDYEYMI